MNNRRVTTLLLAALAAVNASAGGLAQLIGAPGAAFLPAALAETASSRLSPTLLDQKTLQLANKGLWTEAAQRLETLAAADTTATRHHAWLAFADLFLGKGNDLKELAQKVKTLPANSSDPQAAQITETFNLVCQGKLDEANTLATSISTPDNKDVLLNLALAAVSAKRGNPSLAVSYCEKVTGLSPDFAWGYRTLGFIQERSLKDGRAAEAAYQKALAIEPNFKEVRDLLVDLNLTRNNFDGAVDIAQAAIKAAPRDANNYYRLSQIYTQQWRLREATKQLDRAIQLSADNPRFYRAKASILRYQGHLPEAIAEQQKAVDLSKDKAFELIELAALNELNGNEGAAADKLKEALTQAPSNQVAHQKLVQLLGKQKRLPELVDEYRRALVLQPKQAILHLGLAEALLKQAKVDDAINELKEAANLDTSDARPHRALGAIYLERKDYAAAAKAYTRALNINPGSVDDLVALGYTYAQNDDYMQAETAFVTALALQQLTQATGSPSGNRFEVMKSLAVLLLTEGRYSEAATNLEAVTASQKDTPGHAIDEFLLAQAKALRDRSADSLKELAQSFEKLSAGQQSQQAEALADTYLKLNRADLALAATKQAGPEALKSDWQWLLLQARAYRLKGDLGQARQYADQSIAAKDSSDNKAEAYTELAQILLDNGKASEADNAVAKATDLNSKSFTAFEVLGRIYLKKGDREHAIEAGKHSLEINPYYVPAYLLTGDAYLAAGKFDEAANNYKRAVELYPACLDAHRSLRDVYKRLAQKEDAQKEEDIIAQIEKRS